jgi:hypothetical protein
VKEKDTEQGPGNRIYVKAVLFPEQSPGFIHPPDLVQAQRKNTKGNKIPGRDQVNGFWLRSGIILLRKGWVIGHKEDGIKGAFNAKRNPGSGGRVGPLPPSAEEVDEQNDKNEEDKRLGTDYELTSNCNRMDVPVPKRSRGYETVIHVVDSRIRFLIEQMESGINDRKIQCDLNVVKQEEKNGPVGGTGMGKHVGNKDECGNVKQGLQQKVNRKKEKKRMVWTLKIEDHQRKRNLKKDVDLNRQIFIRQAFTAKNVSYVNPWKNELNHDEKKPQKPLQTNIVVPVVFPNASQIPPLLIQNGIVGWKVVFRFSENQLK